MSNQSSSKIAHRHSFSHPALTAQNTDNSSHTENSLFRKNKKLIWNAPGGIWTRDLLISSSQIRTSKFGLRSFAYAQALYPIQRIEKHQSLTELPGHNDFIYYTAYKFIRKSEFMNREEALNLVKSKIQNKSEIPFEHLVI